MCKTHYSISVKNLIKKLAQAMFLGGNILGNHYQNIQNKEAVL